MQQVTQGLPQAEWTNLLQHGDNDPPIDAIAQGICSAFNASPFMAHNQLVLHYINGEMQIRADMAAHLIGNVAYGILHGGVAATMLDSLGGAAAMLQIYKKTTLSWQERCEKVRRLATIDMRVDYIHAGRGNYVLGTAHILRLGTKNCMVRTELHNDSGLLIACANMVYGF